MLHSRPSILTERRDLLVHREITRPPSLSANCCPTAAVKAKQEEVPKLIAIAPLPTESATNSHRVVSINPDVHNHVRSFANPQPTVQCAPRTHQLKVFRRRNDSDCHRVLSLRSGQHRIRGTAQPQEHMSMATIHNWCSSLLVRESRQWLRSGDEHAEPRDHHHSIQQGHHELLELQGHAVDRRVHHSSDPLQGLISPPTRLRK